MRLLSMAALVALSTSTCMHATAPQSALECRVEPRAPLTAGGPVKIRFVLANPSSEPVWFLRWNTPIEGWAGSPFTVTGPDGNEVAYAGPMVKRANPNAEDYVQIPPGAEVDAIADLTEVYDLSKPGRYRLQVTGQLFDLTTEQASVPRPLDQHQGMELRCGEVELDVR